MTWKSEWWRSDAEAFKTTLSMQEMSFRTATLRLNHCVYPLYEFEEENGMLSFNGTLYGMLIEIVALAEYIKQEPVDPARLPEGLVVNSMEMLDWLWKGFYLGTEEMPNVLAMGDMAALRLEYFPPERKGL